MQFIKKDEQTLIVKPLPHLVEDAPKEYNISFLKEQELQITRQLEEYTAARNKELEDVRALIAKCDELNIVDKPKKPVINVDDVVPVEEIIPVEEIVPADETPIEKIIPVEEII